MSAALASPHIDRAYYKCWAGLRSHFCREVTINGAAAHVAAGKGALGFAVGRKPDKGSDPESAWGPAAGGKKLATDAQER